MPDSFGVRRHDRRPWRSVLSFGRVEDAGVAEVSWIAAA
jgi:hypothetical protein